jgi:proline iminopeptidase
MIHRNMYPRPDIGRKVDRTDAAGGLGNSGELSGALSDQGLWRYRFLKAAKVRAPTLIIAGGRDLQAVEAPQRDLAKALPHARFLAYPNDGHFMFVEEPQRFASDLTAFLRRAR